MKSTKPWKGASRKQLKEWIRSAALFDDVFGDYETWIGNMMENLGWSREDCEEFLETFHNRISAAYKHLEEWLNADLY